MLQDLPRKTISSYPFHTLQKEERRVKEGPEKVRTHSKSSISGVVVTSEQIRELVNVISQNIASLGGEQGYSCIVLTSEDGTEYEADFKSREKVLSLLYTRRINRVDIRYDDRQGDRRVEATLSQTKSGFERNEIEVWGYDEFRVNGLMKSVEKLVSNWKRQSSWPRKYVIPLGLIFDVVLGSFLVILNNLLGNPIATRNPPFGELLIACLIMLYPAGYLVYQISALYPTVEFATGPEYSRIEEMRRKKLGQYLTIGFAPLLMSLVIEVLLRILFPSAG